MTPAAPEGSWRDRFRAVTMSLPAWALDRPERAVYLSNASGRYEGYSWDMATDERRQVTDRPEGTLSITLDRTGDSIWWFDDTKGDEKGGWRVQPFEGGEARLAAVDLPPGYSTGIAIGTGLAVIGTAHQGVHRVHVARNGQSSQPIYEHREAAGVGGMSRDESLVVVSHSEHGDSRNRALRVVDLEGATVGEIWDGPGLGFGAGPWSPVRADQRLIVTHERTGSSRAAIWAPEEGRLDDLDVDLPGEFGASWYPDAVAVLLTHLWRGRTELYRFDLTTGELTRIPTEPGVVGAARVRPDGELWYSISTSERPTELRCGSTVLRPPGPPAPPGVRYRDVEAGEVHAFVAEPAEGSRPYPTIFQVHGGPAGLDADHFSPTVQAFVDHGFAVVLVNYRGSSGYGKAWRDAIVGKPGLLELEDIAAVRRALIDDGTTDPNRVVLAGGSWGGYLTLLGLGRQPDLWSLGISAVPLADLEAHYAQQSEPLQAYWRALFGGTPEEIPEVLEEISPIRHAHRMVAPLLILAGDNDPRCPLGQVLNYVAELDRLGKTYELYRYDAGHGSAVVDEQIRQVEHELDMAARHLGTRQVLQ